MAKVQYGIPVTGMRGKLAGLIFTANKSGPYVRTWARGANQSTLSQQNRRGRLGSAGEEWRGMSQATRDAWDTYAALSAQMKTDALGNVYYLSGWQWFISFSMARHNYELNVYTGSPSGVGPAPVNITTVVVNATPTNTAVVTFATPPATGGNACFYAQLDLSGTRPAHRVANYVLVDFLLGTSATNPITLSNLDDFFGPLQVGNRLHVRLSRTTSQGRFGSATYGSGIAA